MLEQKIDERFNQEAQIREEIGSKLINIIEDRFASLKNEISKESANRFECIENLKSYLENDVPKLNEMLNNEKIKTKFRCFVLIYCKYLLINLIKFLQ